MSHNPVNTPTRPERPRFWISLVGFDAAQRRRLADSLATMPGSVSWREGEFADADGWLVNGARLRILQDGNVEVEPGLASERTVKLDLAQVDRPVAFATPLPEDFEPLATFDPAVEASLYAVLLRMEAWLALRRAQFALGRAIVGRGATLRHTVHHLAVDGKLVAVLNFQTGKAALSPNLHPEHIPMAAWTRRPPGAGETPPGFLAFTIAQISWSYVRRTEQKLLPARYLRETIYYRHVPRVPTHWMRDSQLQLLHELAAEGANASALQERTGLSHEQMLHDLSCLYYAGAITTTSTKAARPAPNHPSNGTSGNAALESLIRDRRETGSDDSHWRWSRTFREGTVQTSMSPLSGF